MREIEFEQAVVDLAHTFGWRAGGWRAAKTDKGWRTPVKYDGHGFPDLTLVHTRGIVIFAELKVGSNKLSPEQTVWQYHLTHAECSAAKEAAIPQIRYRLWYPKHSNSIARELSFGRLTTWNI